MYCPSCGKSIPEGSTFCLHCGVRVSLATANSHTDYTPPVSIAVLEFYPAGPVEIQKFFLASDTLGRGFRFTVVLRDDRNNETASDGELIVVLLKKGPFHLPIELLESDTKTARKYLEKRDVTNILWRQSFRLKTIDFKYQVVGEKTRLAYTYIQSAPLLWYRDEWVVELHAWFITLDGKCFYRATKCYWTQ